LFYAPENENVEKSYPSVAELSLVGT